MNAEWLSFLDKINSTSAVVNTSLVEAQLLGRDVYSKGAPDRDHADLEIRG